MPYYAFYEEQDIDVNAEIHFTDDLKALAENYNNRTEGVALKIIGWTLGSFGDCWIKTYQKPEIDNDGNTTIDGILCSVTHPGFHPGGNCYWLTPIDDIYVPVWQSEEDNILKDMDYLLSLPIYSEDEDQLTLENICKTYGIHEEQDEPTQEELAATIYKHFNKE